VHEPAHCQQCLSRDATTTATHSDASPRLVFDDYHRWMFSRMRGDFDVTRRARRVQPQIPGQRARLT
jgi:hypothetical protein